MVGEEIMSDISEKNDGFGIGEAGQVNARDAEIVFVETMVKCACGHSVPPALVMWANLGTCCPDCYDRMSN